MLVDLIRVPDPTCIDDLLDEPLGLLYLGAALRESGFEVRVTDLGGHDGENWIEDIEPADVYGIQLYTPTTYLGVKILSYLNEYYPESPVICGGAHPTALPASRDLQLFDKIISGEGEVALPFILKDWNQQKNLDRIFHASVIEDLNSLPFPARDLVDMRSYHRKVKDQRCFGIIGSRGCNYKCAFCDRSLFGERVRWRSIENIVQEILICSKKWGVYNFEFFDDRFNGNKQRLVKFGESLKSLGLDITYRANSRSDILSKSIYKLMYDSGCRVVSFGIESGSQRLLDLMQKQTKVENNFQAIKNAQNEGLIVIGYFIIGFPGETLDSISQTIEFVEKSGIDQAQFYTFIPLPGCEVYRNPDKFQATIRNYDFSDYYLVTGKDGRGGRVVDTPWMTADEVQEQMKRIREFLKKRKQEGSLQDFYVKKLDYKS